jgi:hypothetical protein
MTQTFISDVHAVRVDGPNEPDKFIFKKFQDIPDWYLKKLRDQADAQKSNRKEMRRVASIPVAIVEAWAKEGFDINNESAQAIVARLQREDLGAFITGLP